ncbi:MAG: protein phosphatase 2C domain-containing protein [Oscillospiraceae bacterium]|nr:protein phosphatase 2C domain-containing protein [Oscillospiraceae bacterium]
MVIFVRKGSRRKPGEACGDVISISNDSRAMMLCDGVSSCPCGARSAREGVNRILSMYESAKEHLWRMIEKDEASSVAALMVRELRAYFEKCARQEGRPLSDFGTTLAFAMHDPERGKIFAFTLGDSSIRLQRLHTLDEHLCGGGRGHVLEASITDPNAENCTVVRVLDDRQVEGLLFLSDGAWRSLGGGGRGLTMEEVVALLRHYRPQDDAAAGVLTIKRKRVDEDA